MALLVSDETKMEIDFISNLLPGSIIAHREDGHAMVVWDAHEHHLEAETIHVMTDWFYRNRITDENVLFTCNFGEYPSKEIQEKFKYFL